MSDLERYIDRVMDHGQGGSALGTPRRPEGVAPRVVAETHGEGPEGPSVNVLAALLRRWYIVLAVFVVVAGIGVPLVWLLVQPGFVVTGAIRVAPSQRDILTGDPDRGVLGNYDQFVNTQALSVTSPAVLERVVDDLVPRNLAFFSTDPNRPLDRLRRRLDILSGVIGPMDRLKRAISSGVISVQPVKRTELIAVTMKSMSPPEASIIVDSIVRNYMAIYAYGATREEEANLRLMENEKRELQEKMQQKNQQIRQLAQEFGTTTLDSRQDMMVQRQAALLTELTRLESSRISLEASLEVPDPMVGLADANQAVDPNAVTVAPMLSARNQYISSDPMVQELTRRIVTMEQDLILTKQTLAPENPTIAQREALLETFRSRLETKREEVGKEFDVVVSEQRLAASEQQKMVAELAAKAKEQQIKEKRLETELAIARIKAHENRLKQILSQEDDQVRQVGRTSLDIQDLQFQLSLDKEMHDTVSRRIKEIEMEGKRDPRITVHAPANVQGYEDKRVKFSAAVAFGALGLGCLLAFLRDKADKRFKTVDDVARRIQLPIIGTIQDPRQRRGGALVENIAQDYQTIRTNLGFFGDGSIPSRLAVASPGTQEGKTTFAINLATSLARSGKRVLLIDGDLRKPDVAGLLGISLQAAAGAGVEPQNGFAYNLCATALTGLDVLAPNSRRAHDPYETLISPDMAQRIDLLGQNYDHMIIDTPPVLAFPDALIWARIARAVVLVSYMGRTTTDDLAQAKARLVQARVHVVGTVLNNVGSDHTYNRYRYSYYSDPDSGAAPRRGQRAKRRLLLPLEASPAKEEACKA